MMMRDNRERDRQRLNSIFLEMGMDRDVASIISGIDKKEDSRKRGDNSKKSVDNNKRR